MFIAKMKCSWLQHPFLKNSFYVSARKDIEKLLDHGVYEVYIDTTKGLDVEDSQTEAEVKDSLEANLGLIAAENRLKPEKVPIHEEYGVALQIRDEALRTVAGVMQQIKLGNPLKLEQTQAIIHRMIDSVARNRNALLTLCRLRQKHEYTYMHCIGVATLMICFCETLDFSRDEIHAAGLAGLFHDIGKSIIPDAILDKAGPLDDEELSLLRVHPVTGKRLLQESGLEHPLILMVAQQHHERFDGSGYPDGLKGDDISTIGQISAIVDVYDALTSTRAYKDALEPTAAIREIYEISRYYFNPRITEHFIKFIGIYPVGTLLRMANGLLGFVTDFSDGKLLEPVLRVVYDTRRNCFVSPYDVNLSKHANKKPGNEIIGSEDPEKWHIDRSLFLEEFRPLGDLR